MVISNWWGGEGEGELRSGEEFPDPGIEPRSPALQSDFFFFFFLQQSLAVALFLIVAFIP